MFTISHAQSKMFADLSADWNPMHVDPEAARRVQFGDTVVHGIHALLAALNAMCSNISQPAWRIVALKANFVGPIFQGSSLNIEIKRAQENEYRIALLANGKTVQQIQFSIESTETGAAILQKVEYSQALPDHLSITDALSFNYSAMAPWNVNQARALMPALSAAVPDYQIAALLATTHVVGMKCPGIDSVFTGLQVKFLTPTTSPTLSFSACTTSTDERFNSVALLIKSDSFEARIDGLFRQKPVAQPAYEVVKRQVERTAFHTVKALVVGGSRGLGELSVKLLAAGGAQVDFTFARGDKDARRILSELQADGARAACFGFDVTDVSTEQFARLACDYSHIFYFPSPQIGRNDGPFDLEKFHRFSQCYVDGMVNLLNHAARVRQKGSALRVVLPSSVFVTEGKKGFAEYIAAKAAAESCLLQICAKQSNWHAVISRLPAMATDQTAGAASADDVETLAHMTDFVRSAVEG